MGFSLNYNLNYYAWFLVILLGLVKLAYGGNFNVDFETTFGDNRVQIPGHGKYLSLSLDKFSGSGFRSKNEYLFGRIDMQMKLVDGNSAGTVTTLYLSSDQSTGRHDEIDFEFLGNVSGQPYTLHTNVFSQGKGNREQQFHLWFDPTKNFHTYSIVWSPKLIMFMVDETPIRVFRNQEKDIGVPFPKSQPMKIYSSIWNADDWATQGGLVKTDWSRAPFLAYYRNFNIDACTSLDGFSCAYTVPKMLKNSAVMTHDNNDKYQRGEWRNHDLNEWGRRRLRWVQKYFMIYDYCKDWKRFSQGFPPECKNSKY